MCAGCKSDSVVLLLLGVLLLLLQNVNAQARDVDDKQLTVLPELVDHPALSKLDLQFCGSGSHSQISKGPLGCGFPVTGDHPWLVALGFKSSFDGSVTFACSGALISDTMVVTSARCAIGTATMKLTTVRAGEYNLTSSKDCLWYDDNVCLTVQDVGVASVLPHPKFFNNDVTGYPSLYDIAVVQLDKKVKFGFDVNSICLPIFPLRRPPKKMFGLSFGIRPQHRQSPAAATVDDANATCCECDRNRSATFNVMDEKRLVDFNTTYIGSEPCQYRLLLEGGKRGDDKCIGDGDPCIADMGAPLVSPDQFGTFYYLLGVASVVPSQDACLNVPGASVVYLPIEMHLSWILDAIHCLANQTCNRI